MPDSIQNKAIYYYVDEAGDGTIFNRDGTVIIGQEGCSRFFMLGLIQAADPKALAEELTALRLKLSADPYFKGVPSMQPENRKTAIAFHAKDDLPEVRREVFSLLARHDIRAYAVVKDKRAVHEYVVSRNKSHADYRYRQDDLYDHLVRRLFKDRLHKGDAYNICFSARGKSDRTKALLTAINTARQRFLQQLGITNSAEITVRSSTPQKCVPLQAVDYYLWALQRLYEKGEERYLVATWKQWALVQDIDDKRKAEYGVYYTQKTPLTLDALRWRGTSEI